MLISDDTVRGAPRKRPGGRTLRHTHAIYDSTLALLAEHGYVALTFNDIATAAGVSRSTLHRRWSSRAELVLDAIGVSLSESIVAPDTGSLPGDMRAVLEQIRDYISTPLGAAALVASVEIGTSCAEVDRPGRWRTRLADFDPMFDRAVARGEIGADFDREVAFAQTAGAVYYRKIFMALPIDDEWIARTMTEWQRALP